MAFGAGYGKGMLTGLAVVMVYGVLFMDWNTQHTPFKGVSINRRDMMIRY